MKKFILILLALVLCVSMCACKSKENSATENSEIFTEIQTPSSSEVSTEEQLKIDDIAGTWKMSIKELSDDSELTINSNSTFDHGNKKGVVTISKNKNSFVLEYRYNGKKTLNIQDEYIYNVAKYFEKDTEYGLAFSPDENGRTNQSFSLNANNFTVTDQCDYTHFSLAFKSDGTYVMKTGWFKKSGEYYYHDFDQVIKGTYTYKDSVITLSNNDGESHIIVGKQGQLYYCVYER